MATGDRPRPGRRPGRAAVFSRRPTGHHRHLGQDRPRRLRGHRRQRARRHQRDRHLRAALQQHRRQHAAPPVLPGEHHRGAPADRRGARRSSSLRLEKIAPTDPALASALDRYDGASAATQTSWNTAYAKAVTKVTFRGGVAVAPSAADGPIPGLIATELTLARSGALDADLIANQAFYGTNFTKPLLFLEDGQYFSDMATADHLTGHQWGVMNETGSYPGQPWLWLYTLWYQVPGFDNSANVDLIAIYLTGAATILLLAVPFIPGLRDIPRLIPVHRLDLARLVPPGRRSRQRADFRGVSGRMSPR